MEYPAGTPSTEHLLTENTMLRNQVMDMNEENFNLKAEIAVIQAEERAKGQEEAEKVRAELNFKAREVESQSRQIEALLVRIERMKRETSANDALSSHHQAASLFPSTRNERAVTPTPTLSVDDRPPSHTQSVHPTNLRLDPPQKSDSSMDTVPSSDSPRPPSIGASQRSNASSHKPNMPSLPPWRREVLERQVKLAERMTVVACQAEAIQMTSIAQAHVDLMNHLASQAQEIHLQLLSYLSDDESSPKRNAALRQAASSFLNAVPLAAKGFSALFFSTLSNEALLLYQDSCNIISRWKSKPHTVALTKHFPEGDLHVVHMKCLLLLTSVLQVWRTGSTSNREETSSSDDVIAVVTMPNGLPLRLRKIISMHDTASSDTTQLKESTDAMEMSTAIVRVTRCIAEQLESLPTSNPKCIAFPAESLHIELLTRLSYLFYECIAGGFSTDGTEWRRLLSFQPILEWGVSKSDGSVLARSLISAAQRTNATHVPLIVNYFASPSFGCDSKALSCLLDTLELLITKPWSKAALLHEGTLPIMLALTIHEFVGSRSLDTLELVIRLARFLDKILDSESPSDDEDRTTQKRPNVQEDTADVNIIPPALKRSRSNQGTTIDRSLSAILSTNDLDRLFLTLVLSAWVTSWRLLEGSTIAAHHKIIHLHTQVAIVLTNLAYTCLGSMPRQQSRLALRHIHLSLPGFLGRHRQQKLPLSFLQAVDEKVLKRLMDASY